MPRSFVDLWLGQQLRQLRKRQSRSLADVAAACGMSVGLLSQVERGLSSLSVTGLHRLAREFGVQADSLLRNAEPADGEVQGRVARAGTHKLIRMDEKGIRKEMYTPPASQGLDLWRASIAPGGSTGEEFFVTSSGEQVGMILQGELELWMENHVVRLETGDSFCYSGNMQRRWCNPGNVTTEVIWAIARLPQSSGVP
ncbi:helix-turn-helix domain-containing protein [Bordetella sp. 2513F-2]